MDDVVCGGVGFCKVCCEAEEEACSLPTEDDGDEDDEELLDGVFVAGDETATVPECEAHPEHVQTFAEAEEDHDPGCAFVSTSDGAVETGGVAVHYFVFER